MRIVIAGSSATACLLDKAIHDASAHTCFLVADQNEQFLQSTGLPYIMVDYTDSSSIQHALLGCHVLISVEAGVHEKALLQEALHCRVKRFIPAHFEGIPANCDPVCPLDNHRAELRMLLAEHRGELQSCLVICGVLYEHLQPSSPESGSSQTDTFDYNAYPIDMNDMTALLPSSKQRSLPSMCLSATQDVANCIARMLDRSFWPTEFRLYSERMSIGRILSTIERVKGQTFARTEHDDLALRAALRAAMNKNDIQTQSRVHHILAMSQGLLDYQENQMSELMPDEGPLRFQDWLSQTTAESP